MNATQHCPLCGGSTFRAVDGHPGMHIICECTQPDLEDTPYEKGLQEGFLKGFKAGCEETLAYFARSQGDRTAEDLGDKVA